MIVYDEFWKTLRKKNITQYQLVHYCGISRSLLNRMKKNQSITSRSVDMLCDILDCDIKDILSHNL